ncbi:hypothetical protein BCR44DRAFT_1015176 [Catenaria anguillulae PL171]|uniref:Uncharacterized protein n=1 Tax=Catenaria anguillulae PL171 TaxID=765915 RepID=A0A1Y2HW70_9FUNG|nr:hypothetical protein BCR44DRAFT_1015176 [Catenaria anguillulae PL171]
MDVTDSTQWQPAMDSVSHEISSSPSDAAADANLGFVPPRAAASIANLSHELLVPIFDLLPHPADLVPSLLACKSLHIPALLSLYSRPIRILTVPRLERFVSQLAASVSNGSLVRRLELVLVLEYLTDNLFAQLGTLCPNLTHLTIQDAVVVRANDSASETDDDVPEYEFNDGEINLWDTKTSGPKVPRHLSSLLELTTQLESLTLKQVKSIDVPYLLTIVASSCSSLHTLIISELDHACRPIGVQQWGYDYLPITTSITQRLSTFALLHTLKLDDVESPTMSALLVQHLACPLLTSLSLCNNYMRSTTDYQAAFAGLLSRHTRLVKLTVLDTTNCDNDNMSSEIVRAALQVWPQVSGGKEARRVLEIGYHSQELKEQVERVFGGRVDLCR